MARADGGRPAKCCQFRPSTEWACRLRIDAVRRVSIESIGSPVVRGGRPARPRAPRQVLPVSAFYRLHPSIANRSWPVPIDWPSVAWSRVGVRGVGAQNPFTSPLLAGSGGAIESLPHLLLHALGGIGGSHRLKGSGPTSDKPCFLCFYSVFYSVCGVSEQDSTE